MPPIYKILISLFVATAAGLAHLFRSAIELDASPVHVAVLAAIMIIGLWMFPEPKKETPRKG